MYFKINSAWGILTQRKSKQRRPWKTAPLVKEVSATFLLNRIILLQGKFHRPKTIQRPKLVPLEETEPGTHPSAEIQTAAGCQREAAATLLRLLQDTLVTTNFIDEHTNLCVRHHLKIKVLQQKMILLL
jgi:hypothetical protein